VHYYGWRLSGCGASGTRAWRGWPSWRASRWCRSATTGRREWPARCATRRRTGSRGWRPTWCSSSTWTGAARRCRVGGVAYDRLNVVLLAMGFRSRMP
jgi:hypothetical protein